MLLTTKRFYGIQTFKFLSILIDIGGGFLGIKTAIFGNAQSWPRMDPTAFHHPAKKLARAESRRDSVLQPRVVPQGGKLPWVILRCTPSTPKELRHQTKHICHNPYLQ